MPIYVYKCGQCGTVFEAKQRMTDAPLAVHDGCGGTVKRMVQAPPIIFNGPGFYVTDSRGKNSAGTTAKQDDGAKPSGKDSDSSS